MSEKAASKRTYLGLGQKNDGPIKIPPPLCPEELKAWKDCVRTKGAQAPCMDIYFLFKDCQWRMEFDGTHS